jgi:hypothetical protein
MSKCTWFVNLDQHGLDGAVLQYQRGDFLDEAFE